jgi:outer membrane protein TolC
LEEKVKALCAFPREFTRTLGRGRVLTLLGILLLLVSLATAQDGQKAGKTQAADPQARSATAQVSLKDLIREAEQKNPEITAAEHGYTAATHVAPQMSALPETQVTTQLLSVGSPLPFAGYTNSDFAYIGLGVSQEIPYPGKRGLRAQVANREADVRMGA